MPRAGKSIGYDRALPTMTIKGFLMRLKRLSRAAAIGVFFSFALSSCVPTNVQQSPAEASAAQDAAGLARQGQFDPAAQAYLVLAGQSSGNADHYRLLAAEAWRQEGQISRAAPTLALIQRDQLTADEQLRLDLLRAELAISRHDAATAMQLTAQVNVAIPPAYLLRLLELRARAMADSGDYWASARTRVQMDDQLSGIDHAQNRTQILSLLGKVGVEQLKQRAAAMQPSDRMLNWVNESLTQQGVEQPSGV